MNARKTIILRDDSPGGWHECKKEHPVVWFRGKDCPVCLAVEVREICGRPVFAPTSSAFLEVRKA